MLVLKAPRLIFSLIGILRRPFQTLVRYDDSQLMYRSSVISPSLLLNYHNYKEFYEQFDLNLIVNRLQLEPIKTRVFFVIIQIKRN